MKEAEQGRRRLVIKRWLNLLWASLLGSAVVLICLGLFPDLASAITRIPVWVTLVTLIAGVPLFFRVGLSRLVAVLGLRHFATYPPIWVAGFFGSAAVLLVVGWSDGVRASTLVLVEQGGEARRIGSEILAYSVAVSGLLALSSHLWGRYGPPRVKAGKVSVRTLGEITKSFESIKVWIATDNPIRTPEDDVLDYQTIARRIADRLTESSAQSQAVVGGLGTGKTSLRNLAVRALESGDRSSLETTIVPVEIWPFETPRAAVEGIVRTLLQELGKEVNVFALRGLPRAYANAMMAAGGALSALVRLQGTPTTPAAVLKRLDLIAGTIGRRYVVWVEDLERFACGGDTAAEPDSLAELERLNPIRALLLQLDQLESVSVVTATTSLYTRFDIEKIARYVEKLPEPPAPVVGNILHVFREGCLRRSDTVDPASPNVRKTLDGLQNMETDNWVRQSLLASDLSVASSLCHLCRTPRVLKQALRQTLDTWERLEGEIDFDDSFTMSILRVSLPQVFSAVEEHINTLQTRPESMRSEVIRKRFDAAQQSWNDALEACKLEPKTLEAVSRIVGFVFRQHGEDDKPQSLSIKRQDVNYWNRFLSVPDLSDEFRDQEALAIIFGKSDEDLLAALENESRHSTIERFQDCLDTRRLSALLLQLAHRRSGESPSDWPQGSGEPPGLIPVWRMWIRHYEKGELLPDQVMEQLREVYRATISKNLAFVAEVDHYFVSSSGHVPNLLRGDGHEQNDEAKAYLRNLLAETYAGKPNKLAAGLRGTAPGTLLWLVWGIDAVRAGDYSRAPFERWGEMAGTILDSARRVPGVMLLQLAQLVTDSATVRTKHGHENQHRFNEGRTYQLFGSVCELLEVFDVQSSDRWKDTPSVMAVFDAIKRLAVRLETS